MSQGKDSGKDLVDKMESVWASIEELCRELSEEEWKTATDCPGWSVQDQLSHLAGSESMILGRPAPDHIPADTSYIKNDIGRRNEVLVDYRRPSTGQGVFQEFKENTGERLKLLRAMNEGDFDAPAQTPIGPGTVKDYLAIRIFDAWVHEQDMRRALDRPGDMEGPVAQHSVGRMSAAMPYIVAKKAMAADGTTVVFSLTGAAGRTVAVEVEAERGREIPEPPLSPTVGLTMDVETFLCLGCGRWEPSTALESGKVAMTGDLVLGEAIINQMNFMI